MNQSLDDYLDRITHGDCLEHLTRIPAETVHLCVSDIPYGINLAEWDVLHSNTNSALLGQSPAQAGKSGFKRRGKPINGWNAADKQISKEYGVWCERWAQDLFSLMKQGGSVFIFGARRTLHRAIVALEDSGFLLRDILAWEKPNAHHRAQSLENLMLNRNLEMEAEKWKGWRVGNLAPKWEPIAWFFKPYRHTIIDNVLEHELGAMNVAECLIDGSSPTNLLRFSNDASARLHEAQKPVQLIEYLIKLTTRENHIVLDPFAGSGTTLVAASNLKRHYIGFEIQENYHRIAQERLTSPPAPCPRTSPE